MNDQYLLTKGDNNMLDDVGLYDGVKHLKRSHIVGKVQGLVSTASFQIFLLTPSIMGLATSPTLAM